MSNSIIITIYLPCHILKCEPHPISGAKVNALNHQKLAEEDQLDDNDGGGGDGDGDDNDNDSDN